MNAYCKIQNHSTISTMIAFNVDINAHVGTRADQIQPVAALSIAHGTALCIRICEILVYVSSRTANASAPIIGEHALRPWARPCEVDGYSPQLGSGALQPMSSTFGRELRAHRFVPTHESLLFYHRIRHYHCRRKIC